MSAKGEGTRAVRALSGREAERSGPTERERGRGLWGLVRVGPRGKRVREGKGWAGLLGVLPFSNSFVFLNQTLLQPFEFK